MSGGSTIAWIAIRCGTNPGGAICVLQSTLAFPLPPQIDFFEAFSDATSLLMYGSVLGWFVGITSPRRFHWLFSRQRWYVWATMLGTPPVYSAIRWAANQLFAKCLPCWMAGQRCCHWIGVLPGAGWLAGSAVLAGVDADT